MKMLSVVKLICLSNIVALLACSYMFARALIFTNVDVRMNFVMLDRAGVINEEPLKEFNPSYGFAEGHIRNSVPLFIAGPALDNEKRNALAGVFFAFFNTTIAGIAWLVFRKTEQIMNEEYPTKQ